MVGRSTRNSLLDVNTEISGRARFVANEWTQLVWREPQRLSRSCLLLPGSRWNNRKDTLLKARGRWSHGEASNTINRNPGRIDRTHTDSFREFQPDFRGRSERGLGGSCEKHERKRGRATTRYDTTSIFRKVSMSQGSLTLVGHECSSTFSLDRTTSTCSTKRDIILDDSNSRGFQPD